MADEKIGKKKVLLVDDDPLFLRYLTRLFPRKEYEVVTVSSGKEALEQARRLRPDLVILDLDMSDLDGIKTCKLLKAEEATRQIAVIILTAMESLELNQMAFDAGAQAMVLKSMNRERLLNIVEVVIQSKSVADSAAVPEA
ncbi:MAG: response regulator [candidate division NC10 bacterium]|nr:response regulator [candidate division NC10 bacterium]MCZ6551630.1 response regulator [candidate division NC10 bacterium]